MQEQGHNRSRLSERSDHAPRRSRSLLDCRRLRVPAMFASLPPAPAPLLPCDAMRQRSRYLISTAAPDTSSLPDSSSQQSNKSLHSHSLKNWSTRTRSSRSTMTSNSQQRLQAVLRQLAPPQPLPHALHSNVVAGGLPPDLASLMDVKGAFAARQAGRQAGRHRSTNAAIQLKLAVSLVVCALSCSYSQRH